MDARELNEVILREQVALSSLLALLEEQHDLLLKNDVIELEGIVQRINQSNKEVAQAEIDRRKLTNGASMKDLIHEFRDEELDGNYRRVMRLLHSLNVQKETNDMLIKMGLGFSSRMLHILNPDRTQKTYNSYGKIRR